jgi:PAS domain S-box-containing protein
MSDVSGQQNSRTNVDDQSFRSVCELIEEKFGELLQLMPDGIIITDPSGKIILVNSQAAKMFGYKRGELVSRMIESLVPVHLREGHVCHRNSYLADPHVRSMGQGGKLFGLRQDGNEFPVEVSLSPLQIDDGLFVCSAVRDITERVRLEDAMRAAEEQRRSRVLEERYFDLYANAPDMCASIEAATGRIVDCNNTLAAATGYSRKELLSMPHSSQLYHPNCEDVRHEVFRAFVETGSVRDAELQLICKDGNAIDVSLSLSAVRDEQGKIVRSRSVWRDITRRKQAEHSLERSNLELEQRIKERTAKLEEANQQLKEESAERRWLTRVYRNSPIGLCCFDTQLRYIDVNEWLAALNGVSVEEHLGRSINEVIPDAAAAVESQLRQVIETGEPILNGEVIAATPADPHVKKHFLHNYYPLKSEQGSVVGVSCAIQDVTERYIAEESLIEAKQELDIRVKQRTKELEESNVNLRAEMSNRNRIEAALRSSEEQLRLVLDSTAEAIYGLDLNGNCTFCNRAFVTTLGYDRAEELIGQQVHNLIHHTRLDGSDYPLHECRIYKALQLGKQTHVDDEVFWKADSSSFPVEYRSFPARRDGEIVGSVVTFLDITEQKRIAAEFRNQSAELAHAARLSHLGEMAAGLAHELNQPLTAMSAFAEGALTRLERGKLAEDGVKSTFSRIAEDAQRAGDIIKRLRNFAQKRESQRHRVDINVLVQDAFKFVESDAKQQDITHQFNLDNGLPAIDADPIEIQQVLLNLIRNATDVMVQTDSDLRKIVISTLQRLPDRVEIVVEDSGPGIPDGMAEQVFEPFYTSKSDGLGIGLGICQNIVEAHGGKIWIGRSSMSGASVHFDLPLHQSGDETDAS